MITVYSDRIEILSRGTLPEKQTLDGFFSGESVPVNKKLSEIFLQLHISEKTGRGVPKIVEKYGKEAFDFRTNSIVVNIPFNWINAMGDKTGNIAGNKATSNGTRLNTTQMRILEEIRNNPNITKQQLSVKTGKNGSTKPGKIRHFIKEKTDDKNTFRLSRQHLPVGDGGIYDEKVCGGRRAIRLL